MRDYIYPYKFVEILTQNNNEITINGKAEIFNTDIYFDSPIVNVGNLLTRNEFLKLKINNKFLGPQYKSDTNANFYAFSGNIFSEKVKNQVDYNLQLNKDLTNYKSHLGNVLPQDMFDEYKKYLSKYNNSAIDVKNDFLKLFNEGANNYYDILFKQIQNNQVNERQLDEILKFSSDFPQDLKSKFEALKNELSEYQA